MDSLDAYRFGEVNKLDPAYLRQTACHEAGHALVSHLCGDTPSFLTVVSRGQYGGYMASAAKEGKSTYTYQELMDRVCCCLAGRVAEIEVYGEVAGTNTGASSDLLKARYYMKTSLNDYAMGEKLYARWTAEEIEQQLKEQYQRTCRMIKENRAVLEALTDRLVEKKCMDQAQLEDFFASMNV
jgi:ATP-dependent Zn protease